MGEIRGQAGKPAEYGTCSRRRPRAPSNRGGAQRQGRVIRGLASELRFRVKFFVALLITSYVVMRLIVYFTRVLAYYFLTGDWRFF
jgi:hypothetical protein